MNDKPLLRDERAISVENASYRVAYILVAYGLLIIIAVRSIFYQQSNWDLMALVIVSGLASTAYQVRSQTVPKSWLYGPILIAIVCALITALIVLVRTYVF